MAIRKAEFNWSLLDREYIAEILWKLRPEVVDVTLKVKNLHSILAKHIRQHLPVRVSKYVDPKVDPGWIYIGGSYYSEYDKKFHKCIEINFNYNTYEKQLCLSRTRFRRLCYTFADTLLHELIHMRQYRRRKFKDLPDYESTAELITQRAEQSYLGCTDEIDAYAFNMACELMDRFSSNQKMASEYLSTKHRKGRLKSNTLRMYLKAFDYNHNHRIIKHLKKRTIMYLPKAELGRPYLTKDWIDR
jgi:hypothetical protein